MAFAVERVAALRPRQTEARGREKLFARRTERGRWRPASMVCHSRVNGNSGLLCMHSIRFPSGGRFVPTPRSGSMVWIQWESGWVAGGGFVARSSGVRANRKACAAGREFGDLAEMGRSRATVRGSWQRVRSRGIWRIRGGRGRAGRGGPSGLRQGQGSGGDCGRLGSGGRIRELGGSFPDPKRIGWGW